MEIRTKDGIVLKGIPDETPEADIRARIDSIRAGNTKPLPVQEKTAAEPSKPVTFTPEMTELSFAEKMAQKVLPGGGFSDETVDMANNIASGATSLNRGIGNLVAGEKKFQPKDSPTGNPVDKGSLSYLGGQIIDPTSWALMGGMSKLPGMGIQSISGSDKLLKLAKNVSAGASTGAVMGGLSEDGTASDGAVAGGVIGGLLPAGISGINYGVRKGKHLFQNADVASGRFANEVAEHSGKRDQIIAALQEKNLPFTGTANSGQAAAKVGSPEFAALQEFSNVNKPAPAMNLANFQEAQRASTLNSIGRGENELAAAVANRSAKSRPFYGKADKAKVVIDKEMNDVLERMPKGVMAKAEEIAKMEGRDLKIGKYAPEREKFIGVLDAAGNKINRIIPEENQKITGESLHYIKRALSDISNASPLTGIGVDEQAAARRVLGDFVGTFEKKVPDYGSARKVYSDLSKPVNRMETGQLLQKTLKTPLETGERAGVFAKAVDDAPKTLKKSTGFPRFNKLDDVLDKTEVSAVDRVTQELMTNAAQKDLAQKGMQATGKILGAQVKPPQIPNPLYAPITYANSIFRHLTGKISDRTLDALAVNMNNPQKMAQLMQQASAAERDLIGRAFMKYGTEGAVSVGARQGGE